MNHFTASALLTSAASLAVSLYALAQRDGSAGVVKRLFALYWFSIAFWSFFVGLQAVFLHLMPEILWGWLLHAGVLFVPTTFFHFSLILTQRLTKHRTALFSAYGLTLAFLALNSFTTLFTHGVAYREGYAYPIPARLYLVFFVCFIAFVLWGTTLLFRHLHSARPERKGAFGTFLAFHLLACVGGMDNFAIMWDIKIFPLYPFGLYAVVLYACAALYALKRKAFSPASLPEAVLSYGHAPPEQVPVSSVGT